MKSPLNVLHRQPQNDRAAVRTSCRRCRYKKPVDQPLHLFGRQFHIDLDGRFARETGGDARHEASPLHPRFADFDRIKNFGKRFRASDGEQIRRNAFDRDRPARKANNAKAERRKIVFDQMKYLTLGWRQINGFG